MKRLVILLAMLVGLSEYSNAQIRLSTSEPEDTEEESNGVFDIRDYFKPFDVRDLSLYNSSYIQNGNFDPRQYYMKGEKIFLLKTERINKGDCFKITTDGTLTFETAIPTLKYYTIDDYIATSEDMIPLEEQFSKMPNVYVQSNIIEKDYEKIRKKQNYDMPSYGNLPKYVFDRAFSMAVASSTLGMNVGPFHTNAKNTYKRENKVLDQSQCMKLKAERKKKSSKEYGLPYMYIKLKAEDGTAYYIFPNGQLKFISDTFWKTYIEPMKGKKYTFDWTKTDGKRSDYHDLIEKEYSNTCLDVTLNSDILSDSSDPAQSVQIKKRLLANGSHLFKATFKDNNENEIDKYFDMAKIEYKGEPIMLVPEKMFNQEDAERLIVQCYDVAEILKQDSIEAAEKVKREKREKAQQELAGMLSRAIVQSLKDRPARMKKKYGEKFGSLINKREFAVGMTEEMCNEISSFREAIYIGNKKEVYIYKGILYYYKITFVNGKVTNIVKEGSSISRTF